MGAFGGDTAGYYARYRRGYPDAIVDAVAERLHLGSDDVVVDLGCGTGLLTEPLTARVRLVMGVDPEADMLAIARASVDPEVEAKIVWVVGSDADLPALGALVGPASLAAVTVGQALHLMDHVSLFERVGPLLRPGAGIAVVANGVPLWQQDSDWSRSLRTALEDWFHTRLTAKCGTDPETQALYRAALQAAGYEVFELEHTYSVELTMEQVLGGIYSAISPADLPADRRGAFPEHLTAALPHRGPFIEIVPVVALVGVRR